MPPPTKEKPKKVETPGALLHRYMIELHALLNGRDFKDLSSTEQEQFWLLHARSFEIAETFHSDIESPIYRRMFIQTLGEDVFHDNPSLYHKIGGALFDMTHGLVEKITPELIRVAYVGLSVIRSEH